MATAEKLITAEQFMAMDLGEGAYELVRGEVVRVPPPRPRHGRTCLTVGYVLESFGRRTGLGYAIGNDAAVVTERGPDTVRGADISFYSEARWPRAQVGDGLPPVVPDLVVEVVSPSDRPGEIRRKIDDYLNAGVRMVWVVDPAMRTVLIYRPDAPAPALLGEADVIEGPAELPGFRRPVAEFFA